jgi:hypothetical protein
MEPVNPATKPVPGRCLDMRATITFAMLVLAALVGFLTLAVAQPTPAPSPPAPVYYSRPQSAPAPTPRPAPAVAAPFGALYNTISGNSPSPNCPRPLTPYNAASSCR